MPLGRRQGRRDRGALGPGSGDRGWGSDSRSSSRSRPGECRAQINSLHSSGTAARTQRAFPAGAALAPLPAQPFSLDATSLGPDGSGLLLYLTLGGNLRALSHKWVRAACPVLEEVHPRPWNPSAWVQTLALAVLAAVGFPWKGLLGRSVMSLTSRCLS